MKRILFVSIIVLLLAACSSTGETETEEERDAQGGENTTTQHAEDGNTLNGEENSMDESVSNENEEESVANGTEQADGPEDKTSADSGEQEASLENELVSLAEKIIDAQDKHDVAYIQSVSTSGVKVDEDKNTLFFENVTYPHEQAFLTRDEIGTLEHRYLHEEDENTIIVGFGAINYETESSFTIDFQFIKENAKWKMNDMDINK